MRKKCIIFLAAGLLCISCIPKVPVCASTIADQIQQRLEEENEGGGEDVLPEDISVPDVSESEYPGGDMLPEDMPEEEAPAEIPSILEGMDLSSPEGIDTAIRVLYDAKFVNTGDVQAVRKAYEALPMSGKVSVANADLLLQIEEKTGQAPEKEEEDPAQDEESQAVNTKDPTQEDRLAGREYTFKCTDDAPSLTIILRFIEDIDSDGRGDVPKITLISPSMEEIAVDISQDELSTGKIQAAITATENFAQFDIIKASAGNWTISTTSDVMFERMEFQGTLDIIEDESTDSSEKEEIDPEPQESMALQYIRFFGVMGLLLFVLIFAVFILPRMLTKKPEKKEESENKNKDRDPSSFRRKTPEEEMAELRQQFEEYSEEMMAIDKEMKNQLDREQESRQKTEENDRLYVTQQDIDNDASITEYDGFGTGLLGPNEEDMRTDGEEDDFEDAEEDFQRFS